MADGRGRNGMDSPAPPLQPSPTQSHGDDPQAQSHPHSHIHHSQYQHHEHPQLQLQPPKSPPQSDQAGPSRTLSSSPLPSNPSASHDDQPRWAHYGGRDHDAIAADCDDDYNDDDYNDDGGSDDGDNDDDDNDQAGRGGESPEQSAGPPSATASPDLSHPAVLERTATSDDPKKHRACEQCRSLKVKCDMPEVGESCLRCRRSTRECVVTPSRRRRRKGDRIKHLEARLQDLENRVVPEEKAAPVVLGPGSEPVQGRAAQAAQTTSPRNAAATASYAAPLGGGGNRPDDTRSGNILSASRKRTHSDAFLGRAPPHGPVPLPPRPPAQGRDEIPPSGTPDADIDPIIEGIISQAQAERLFERYTNELAPHLPAVVFPQSVTAEAVRGTKPVLFLAIMAAASNEDHTLQPALVQKLMRVLAEKTVVRGQKSMDLLQALLVAVLWYFPPDNFEELKFFQLLTMAAAMAIDLGLGKRKQGGSHGPHGILGSTMQAMPRFSENGPYQVHGPLPLAPRNPHIEPRSAMQSRGGGGGGGGGGEAATKQQPAPRFHPPVDPSSLESMRTWLACYFLTSNAFIALRRPNMLRWSSFMTECLQVLRSHPGAAPTDEYLCHLVWTHCVAEDMGLQFLPADWGASDGSARRLTDSSTQNILKGFETRVKSYGAAVPDELMTSSLSIAFPIISLYVHETALRTDGHPAIGAAATLITPRGTGEPTPPHPPLSPAHIHSLTACFDAIDATLAAFHAIPVLQARCLPSFCFVRVMYAVVVLLKFYFLAHGPGSEIGTIFGNRDADGKVDDLGIEGKLYALVWKFSRVVGTGQCRPAGKFMGIMLILRNWLGSHLKHTKRRGLPAYAVADCAGSASQSTTSAARTAPQTTTTTTTGGATSTSTSTDQQRLQPQHNITEDGVRAHIPPTRPGDLPAPFAALGRPPATTTATATGEGIPWPTPTSATSVSAAAATPHMHNPHGFQGPASTPTTQSQYVTPARNEQIFDHQQQPGALNVASWAQPESPSSQLPRYGPQPPPRTSLPSIASIAGAHYTGPAAAASTASTSSRPQASSLDFILSPGTPAIPLTAMPPPPPFLPHWGNDPHYINAGLDFNNLSVSQPFDTLSPAFLIPGVVDIGALPDAGMGFAAHVGSGFGVDMDWLVFGPDDLMEEDPSYPGASGLWNPNPDTNPMDPSAASGAFAWPQQQ